MIRSPVLIFTVLILLLSLSFLALRGRGGITTPVYDQSREISVSPEMVPHTPVAERRTLLFVGDMMFARGVETLTHKNGFSYPTQKINRFLSGVDIVVGNLEGPIVHDHTLVPGDSMRFNFPVQTAASLYWAGFDLVSLANNHTLDRGQEGYLETREILTANRVGFVGHPLTCESESAVVRNDVVFMAFNKTFPQNCSDQEIARVVVETGKLYPDSFLVVMLHWGNEYQLTASAPQQKLAHALIDSGVDVIIGHHPHVVQNIELYKNKPIFYSLGNFIFDQYFSADTQQGLAVGVELSDTRVSYRLYPVDGHFSQPFLMPSSDKSLFLDRLSSRTHPDLSAEIKNGILTVAR